MVDTLTKRGPGRPKDESLPERRREEILSVAIGVFADYGYPKTDPQLIADEIGIGKGTIYRYFESKEALFLAAVDLGMERLAHFVESRVATIDDPLEKIAGAIRFYLRFFDQNPEVLELLIQERAEFRDRKKPTYLKHREKNIGPWLLLLQALVDEGRVRNLQVETITETISCLLYGTIFTGYFNKSKSNFEEKTIDIVDIVFAGILGDTERRKLDKYLKMVGEK